MYVTLQQKLDIERHQWYRSAIKCTVTMDYYYWTVVVKACSSDEESHIGAYYSPIWEYVQLSATMESKRSESGPGKDVGSTDGDQERVSANELDKDVN